MVPLLDLVEIYGGLKSDSYLNVGEPVLFIRLFGTNYKDKNCLRQYTIDKDLHLTKQLRQKLSTEEALILIAEAKVADKSHWVITGGEPLLQQAAILELKKAFEVQHNKTVRLEWETNGTIKPSEETDKVTASYFINLKLGNSLQQGLSTNRDTFDARIKSDPVKFFAVSDKAYFTFMVASQTDVKDAEEIIRNFNIRKERVSLMPLFTDLIQFKSFAAILYPTCILNGYSLHIPISKLLYQDKQGF